jgi:hypothetical protein
MAWRPNCRDGQSARNRAGAVPDPRYQQLESRRQNVGWTARRPSAAALASSGARRLSHPINRQLRVSAGGRRGCETGSLCFRVRVSAITLSSSLYPQCWRPDRHTGPGRSLIDDVDTAAKGGHINAWPTGGPYPEGPRPGGRGRFRNPPSRRPSSARWLDGSDPAPRARDRSRGARGRFRPDARSRRGRTCAEQRS